VSRNSKVLASFVAYCEAHPDERFWQALRNWSEYSFILASAFPPYEMELSESRQGLVVGTFYWEGRQEPWVDSRGASEGEKG